MSTPWTPPHKAALTANKLSPTLPGSHSSSFCGQASTINAAPTQCQHLSNYGTSSSSLAISQPQPPPQPHKNVPRPPLSVSSSLLRRTESKDNLFSMVPQDTPGRVQWRPSGDVWHILDTTAPPTTTSWPEFSTRKNRHYRKALTLPMPSKLKSPLQGHRLDSPRKRSAQAPCAQAAPGNSSLHELTQTRFCWWGDGGAMQ